MKKVNCIVRCILFTFLLARYCNSMSQLIGWQSSFLILICFTGGVRTMHITIIILITNATDISTLR